MRPVNLDRFPAAHLLGLGILHSLRDQYVFAASILSIFAENPFRYAFIYNSTVIEFVFIQVSDSPLYTYRYHWPSILVTLGFSFNQLTPCSQIR